MIWVRVTEDIGVISKGADCSQWHQTSRELVVSQVEFSWSRNASFLNITIVHQQTSERQGHFVKTTLSESGKNLELDDLS